MVQDSLSLKPSVLKRDMRRAKGLEKLRDETELDMTFPHASTVCVSISIRHEGHEKPWFIGMGANRLCELEQANLFSCARLAVTAEPSVVS
jgi:hypothetical protein